MSGFQALEPQPTGEVLLKTTVGDIQIELFAKQTPLASRNFLQLCLDGYYDDTIFHRIVPGFILQGGDPTGTGSGGESSFKDGKPFTDEFHPRLKFNRRGLLGMANGGGKDDNGSQFFFTLDKTPELDGKNTMFGRVEGDTIYNIMKMAEAEVIAGTERPMYPAKISSAVILRNPFDDMVKRENSSRRAPLPSASKMESKKKAKRKIGKNALSFGGDDEGEDFALPPAIKKARFNPTLMDSHKQIPPSKNPVREHPPLVKKDSAQAEALVQSKTPEQKISLPSRTSQRASEPDQRASSETDPDSSEDEVDNDRASKSQAFIDRTNEEIAKLKASMKRSVPAVQETASRSKTGLEVLIPASSTRGRKRRGGGARDQEAQGALDMLNAFRAKLDGAPASEEKPHAPSSPSSSPPQNGGRADDEQSKPVAGNAALDEEAALCDLHFIANCQSCTRWDNAGVQDDEDLDSGWMSHSLTFAKDRLGKDLEWKRKNEEDLVVIDPREKEKEMKIERREKKREWNEGKVRAKIKA